MLVQQEYKCRNNKQKHHNRESEGGRGERERKKHFRNKFERIYFYVYKKMWLGWNNKKCLWALLFGLLHFYIGQP